MTSDLSTRWIAVVAALTAEANAPDTDLNDLLQRVRQVLLRCPLDELESELWTLHDRLVVMQTSSKDQAAVHNRR